MRADNITRSIGTHGKLAVSAVLLAAALLSQSAFADDTRSAKAHLPTPPLQLCIEPGSSPECDAAFAAALKSAEEPAEIVVAATSLTPPTRLRGVQPLRFQKRAPWVRRLETIGKEGIPFVRVPRGPSSELIVGINRKGMLGFQLKQISNR